MNTKAWLIISAIVNFILIAGLLVYWFSPMFDYIVVSKSVPRLCINAQKQSQIDTINWCNKIK